MSPPLTLLSPNSLNRSQCTNMNHHDPKLGSIRIERTSCKDWWCDTTEDVLVEALDVDLLLSLSSALTLLILILPGSRRIHDSWNTRNEVRVLKTLDPGYYGQNVYSFDSVSPEFT